VLVAFVDASFVCRSDGRASDFAGVRGGATALTVAFGFVVDSRTSLVPFVGVWATVFTAESFTATRVESTDAFAAESKMLGDGAFPTSPAAAVGIATSLGASG
jgi:hypothetical protein